MIRHEQNGPTRRDLLKAGYLRLAVVKSNTPAGNSPCDRSEPFTFRKHARFSIVCEIRGKLFNQTFYRFGILRVARLYRTGHGADRIPFDSIYGWPVRSERYLANPFAAKEIAFANH